MVRTAVAVLALAILPGLALAQEGGTHTVVRGETLWGIAARYYRDGYQWTRIYEANRDKISNPDRVETGTVLVIPGAGAQVQVSGVQVTTEPVTDPMAPAPVEDPDLGIGVPFTRQQGPLTPTVFRRGSEESLAGVGFGRDLFDVPPQRFYAAPWLIPAGTVPARTGEFAGFSGGESARAERASAYPFDRLNVDIEGAAPAVGTRLQVFRVERDIRDVGQVVRPTGILVVREVAPGGVVAMVEAQFARIVLGDLVRPLPPYTPRMADDLRPAAGGADATILGFAIERALPSLGDHMFLDVGGDQGVRIGDEYVVVWREGPEWTGEVEGRAKVVSVLPGVSTAEIVDVRNPVFVTGARLAPSRRLP